MVLGLLAPSGRYSLLYASSLRGRLKQRSTPEVVPGTNVRRLLMLKRSTGAGVYIGSYASENSRLLVTIRDDTEQKLQPYEEYVLGLWRPRMSRDDGLSYTLP